MREITTNDNEFMSIFFRSGELIKAEYASSA